MRWSTGAAAVKASSSDSSVTHSCAAYLCFMVLSGTELTPTPFCVGAGDSDIPLLLRMLYPFFFFLFLFHFPQFFSLITTSLKQSWSSWNVNTMCVIVLVRGRGFFGNLTKGKKKLEPFEISPDIPVSERHSTASHKRCDSKTDTVSRKQCLVVTKVWTNCT